jgi:hypothetical protein
MAPLADADIPVVRASVAKPVVNRSAEASRNKPAMFPAARAD